MPIAALLIIVVAVIGIGAYVVTDKDTEVTPTTDTEIVARTDSETPTDTTPEPVTTSGDDDEEDTMTDSAVASTDTATYSALATYLTPARTEHEIEVVLEVATDGTIASADVIYDGKDDGYSNPNQERFDNAFETAVVGQSLSELDLAVTGGASLTTGAFNEALAEIKAEANTSAS